MKTSELSPSIGRITVNTERLWDCLMTHGQIGHTSKGGLNRLALTELDKQGRDLFKTWCEEAGCTVSVDEIGNIFARRPGLNNDLPPVMTGSHIDTQPTGGKFDGCFGVMAGLEAIRTLNDLNIQTHAPIEVVAWTNEEGSRFPPCMMGSGVFTGKFSLNDALSTKDDAGISVKEALDAIGYNGTKSHIGHKAAAYYEAHIEQGPVLEDERKQVGVVIGALGQKWFDIEITGVEAHAGPTPMHLRKDASLAGAELILFINELAIKNTPHGRGTVGCFDVFPSSRNVIPGRVKMTADLRHLESDVLEIMVQDLRSKINSLDKKYGVQTIITPTADFPPIAFDSTCVSNVRDAASKLGYPNMDVVSGAGHDAIFMAEVTSAGMIFVPCEGGISHNELERAKAEDLGAGASVLLNVLLSSAGVAVHD
ncbi:Zn-dependent hydrolase [Neptunomonas antarctica]|uniref:N-carbamoyl-L-amino-acid hydrolase n=1 Tax=Neptunomonas antarctica TaxID=619304 RepID=A0A1N7LN20_9GAMM|nr:Zn-dependent hydrolase [Neptunomonas antarctica]SIS75220.1 N-carbamoyl-L-amino-acid hydrolase [Neptunomonas antarctica]